MATRLPLVDESPEGVEAAWRALRPRTRGECEGVPRPCPFASCVHHLAHAVERDGRALNGDRGRTLVDDIDNLDPDWSCALDVADRGGATLEELGERFGVTRERIRQLEAKALAKVRKVAERRGLDVGLFDAAGRGDALELERDSDGSGPTAGAPETTASAQWSRGSDLDEDALFAERVYEAYERRLTFGGPPPAPLPPRETSSTWGAGLRIVGERVSDEDVVLEGQNRREIDFGEGDWIVWHVERVTEPAPRAVQEVAPTSAPEAPAPAPTHEETTAPAMGAEEEPMALREETGARSVETQARAGGGGTDLAPSLRDALDALRDFWRTKRRAPDMAELGAVLKTTPAGAQQRVVKLRAAGRVIGGRSGGPLRPVDGPEAKVASAPTPKAATPPKPTSVPAPKPAPPPAGKAARATTAPMPGGLEAVIAAHVADLETRCSALEEQRAAIDAELATLTTERDRSRRALEALRGAA